MLLWYWFTISQAFLDFLSRLHLGVFFGGGEEGEAKSEGGKSNGEDAWDFSLSFF